MKQKIFTFFLAMVASVGMASAAITVRLDPESCQSWNKVYLWAWATEYSGQTTNLFDAWPGVVVEKDSDGWWAYTFDMGSIKDVNIIWTDGTNQTVDITHVTESTYYRLESTIGNGINVTTAVSGKLYKIGDLYYDLDGTSKTAKVTSDRSVEYYSGTIVIPDCVKYKSFTYSVTSIEDYAFYGCTGLTSVTIPNSVTSIGDHAFSGCTGLTSVTIPNSLKSIGERAFYGCTGLTSITIPDRVAYILNYAFFNCTSLKSVTLLSDAIVSKAYSYYSSYKFNMGTIFGNQVEEYIIGEDVKSIGGSAFYGCTGLTSITIPNSVTSIGYQAFSECAGLKSVNIYNLAAWCKIEFGSSTGSNPLNYAHNIHLNGELVTDLVIPNSVDSIGNYAFSGCTGLTSVTIGNSVTSIGYGAFRGCAGLTSVTIPNSVTSIGESAFSECTGLTSVTIGNSVDNIGESAFSGCTGLTSVTIPNNVKSIGTKSFYGCTGLKFVNILNSVIGDYAFSGCTGLTSVTIPNSVTSIGNYAFSGCTGLKSVNILNSVIGTKSFYGCTGLTSVTIPNSVTSIGDHAFSDCSGLKSVTLNSNSIASKAYPYDSNIGAIFGNQVEEYIIGDSVTSIGNNAFEDCTGLKSVTIGNSVTSIGLGAFSGCTGMTSVTIPNSVTSIGSGAFYNCTRLTSVTIPNSVTSIGERAFYDCKGLTSVTIPNSVTSIGQGAFLGCAGLIVIINSHMIMNAQYSSNYSLENIFGNQVEEYIIGEDVKSIGGSAFYGCTGLTSVTIPNSVTSIGDHAFSGCTGLKSVNIYDLAAWCKIEFGSSTGSNPLNYAHNIHLNGELVTDLVIPNSVDSIGNYAFSGCTGLTSVTIGNSVTSIGYGAFRGCAGLTSVTIPNSVTSIGESAFSECTGLTSVTIGNSVDNIGESAFSGCTGLTSVTLNSNSIVSKSYSWSSNIGTIFENQVEEYIIGDSVTSIGESAFYRCTGLTSVTIGNSVTSIGVSAFSNCSSLTSVTIPNSVTSIGESAFYGCTSLPVIDNLRYADTYLVGAVDKTLSSYIIKEGTRWVGTSAFSGCTSMLTIEIPNSVTSIGNYAFSECAGLKSVDIPNSVTSIGDHAFRGCTGLTSVTCLAPTPPSLEENVFGDIKDIQSIPLYVLKASASLYKEKDQWKDFNIKLYDPEYFTITATAQNGIVEGAGTFKEDTTIQLLAIPKEGYFFKKWSDGITTNPRPVSVTNNAVYEVEFVKIEIPAGSVYLPYGESFVDEMGRFSIKDVDLGGLNYVWATTRNYGMKASSYTNECHAAESWLISPWVSLYNAEDVVLSFNHAVKYGTSDYLSVKVYSYAKQSWRNITSNLNWPADTYWNYVSTSVSLNAYVNDVIKIAFIYNYYGYDSNDCPTWEIDNFSVKGTVTPEQPLPIDVESKETSADVTWLTVSNANTYELIIRDKDGNVVCSIIFDAEGHAQSVNHYAPSLDKSSQQAQTNDFAYTVTGLTSNTDYNFILVAKDDDDKVVTTYSGSFHTKGNSPQDIEDIPLESAKTVKFLRNGQVLILRGDKVYTVTGLEVR